MSKAAGQPANTDVDIKTGRLTPQQYDENFGDIHPPLDGNNAVIEANRCYFCYDAPCVQACPTSIDIPLFIRKISTGNVRGAAKTILEANIMGGACARVCPVEELCEQACVRNTQSEKPVKIGQLQRHATDHLFARKDAQIFTRKPATGKKIAVVGAGPAGLACAHQLAQDGHDITIFESRPKAGGLNEYGIAAYKVPDDFAQREVDYILSIGGITIKHGQTLGKEITLAQLRKDFDAVFLGLGLAGVNALGLEGENIKGVENAVDYIEALRTAKDKSKLPVGRRIVVIGGGNTAIDIAIQIKRLGAEDVTLAYRRGPENMSATDWECELAQTNDVRIRHWSIPKKILSTGGHVTGIEFEYAQLDKSGRLTGTGDTYTLPADQVFKAIGQTFVAAPLGHDAPQLTKKGRIAIDHDGLTSLGGVWAGGDCTEGQDLTVAAVAGGKRAALAITRALKEKKYG
ncbi:MAG: NAD(P)-dependent oxidoreductase [Alphaproteobacteria bacterium]|nr:NAD(P)-dependent oxidoreductase [Alphaproteobacteria bacterium]MDE2337123.1 NAD(P)-dependent oxidoreductase [Alphaproteobacteria bacterium]